MRLVQLQYTSRRIPSQTKSKNGRLFANGTDYHTIGTNNALECTVERKSGKKSSPLTPPRSERSSSIHSPQPATSACSAPRDDTEIECPGQPRSDHLPQLVPVQLFKQLPQLHTTSNLHPWMPYSLNKDYNATGWNRRAGELLGLEVKDRTTEMWRKMKGREG